MYFFDIATFHPDDEQFHVFRKMQIEMNNFWKINAMFMMVGSGQITV